MKVQTSQNKAVEVVGPTRQDRGRRIYEYGGQITRIDDIEYEVKSQTWPDRAYAVFRTERGWICSCPDHMEAGHQCKHIHAVDMSIRMREAVQDTVTIHAVRPGQCKCGGTNTVKDSIRKPSRRAPYSSTYARTAGNGSPTIWALSTSGPRPNR